MIPKIRRHETSKPSSIAHGQPRAVQRLGWLCAIAWFGAAALLLGGCAAKGPVARGAVFESPKLGYRIDRPGAALGTEGLADSGWRQISVEGADLAFQRSEGAGTVTMTLQSDCRESEAPAEIRARNLLIGVGPRKIYRSGPMALGRDQGWSQTFDIDAEGIPLRVKTVTLVSGGCTFDWVLVSPGPLRDVEESFDSWWSSFERGGGDRSALADARRPG